MYDLACQGPIYVDQPTPVANSNCYGRGCQMQYRIGTTVMDWDGRSGMNKAEPISRTWPCQVIPQRELQVQCIITTL